MKKHYWILLITIFIAAFLRIYKLGSNPPSLYWDEASLGYNAYSILTTGYDEHGEKFPITRFIAFGDYKPPGYIYAIVPFMAIFGVSEFAIRFPSALAGILMALFTYLITYRLTKNQTISLLAAGLLCISPWSLQLSRAAFEANLGALFNLVGIYLFICAKNKKWLYILSVVFFCLAFYTFNSNRILSPLFLILLSLIYFREIIFAKKWIFLAAVMGILMIWPSISYLQNRESRLRFDEVSIFTDLEIIKTSNVRIAREGGVWWAKLLYNRRIFYTKAFLMHFVDHFKGEFLFINGDKNPRLSIQSIGEMYLFELPFLLAGLYIVIMKRSRLTILLFSWLLIAQIPAAVARETPHMLRTASVLPVYQIFTAIGAFSFWHILKQQHKYIKIGSLSLFTLLIVSTLFNYAHNYWIHYSRDWYGEWQYGYKQLVNKVSQLEKDYDRINVLYNLGRPYIYFLLYEKINPLEYVKTRQAERDWYGFWTIKRFGKYDFVGKPEKPGEKVLRVYSQGAYSGSNKLDEIIAPDGKVIFELGKQ